MRVSVDKDDAGFVKDSYNYQIIFDGEEIFNCITADDDAGECLVHVTDDDGRLVLDDLHQSIKTEVIAGKVEIIDRAG